MNERETAWAKDELPEMERHMGRPVSRMLGRVIDGLEFVGVAASDHGNLCVLLRDPKTGWCEMKHWSKVFYRSELEG
jgi:hypothetical protein